MAPVQAEFGRVLAEDGRIFTAPRLRMVSTGGSVAADLRNPAYWVEQIRRPVCFAEALCELDRQGVRAFAPALEDLATVSRLSRRDRLRHLVLPQLAPWLAVAARNGIAVIWKIVLVVEFLGRSNGIGFRVHLYFQQFETTHVLVYSLAFVAVMLVVEHFVIQRWEAHSVRWKRALKNG